jgi:hypothetical protein
MNERCYKQELTKLIIHDYEQLGERSWITKR